MAETSNPEKKTKANAAKFTDTVADTGGSLVGATHEAPPPGASRKKGKLPAKNKHRLPRRQKKVQHRAAGRL